MSEEEKKEPEKDIFLEASMQSLNAKIKTIKTRTVTLEERSEIESIAAEVQGLQNYKPPTKKSEWLKLKKDLDNDHAKRFNEILNELPDREFVRVYLKALEFTKPKIIREARQKGAKSDTTINIQINRGNEKT
jgi:adenylate cyclase class IV